MNWEGKVQSNKSCKNKKKKKKELGKYWVIGKANNKDIFILWIVTPIQGQRATEGRGLLKEVVGGEVKFIRIDRKNNC